MMKATLPFVVGLCFSTQILAASIEPEQDAKFAEVLASMPAFALTLHDAEAMAVSRHPRVGAADARVAVAAQRVKEARANYFPQVTANATVVGVDGGSEQISATGALSYSSMVSRESDGILVSQLLTDFGKTAALTASAKASADSAKADAVTVRAQVLLQVDLAFFELLEAQAVQRVADETVKERELLLSQVSALAGGNFKSQLDVSFARVDVGQAKLLQLRAQNRVSEAYARLAEALGYEEEVPMRPVDATPFTAPAPNLTALIKHAFEQRPELLSLIRKHDADIRFLTAQKASRLPTVQALGAVGVNPFHEANTITNNYAAAGVNVGVPLFTGGRITAQIAEADAAVAESERLLKTKQNEVARDVRTAFLRAATAYKRIAVVTELLNNANQSLDLAKDRYQGGLSSIIELSQAQLNKTQAEIDMSTARYDYQILAAYLKYELGDFR